MRLDKIEDHAKGKATSQKVYFYRDLSTKNMKYLSSRQGLADLGILLKL